MKEVSLQGVQVSPTQLDVKQHSNKTLSELQRLLQTASTLKGAVASVSKEGDVIFTTMVGKFSSPLLTPGTNLNKGDKLSFKIEINNEQLLGRIVTVNGTQVKGTKLTVLNLIEHGAGTAESPKNRASAENVDVHALKLPNFPLRAVISYLNLSQISKNSILSKVLTPAQNGSEVEFKVVGSNVASYRSPYSITGEVLSSEGAKQIIKTPFGILTAKNAESLPVGKKIQIDIKAVNNLPVDNITLPSKVEDFIFKLNNNASMLKSLLNISSFRETPQTIRTNNSSNLTDDVTSTTLPLKSDAQTANQQATIDNKHVGRQGNETQINQTNNLKAQAPNHLLARQNLILEQLAVVDNKSTATNLQKLNRSEGNINNHIFVENDEVDARQALKTNTIIEKALEIPQQKEAIQKLAEDFNKIKELFNINVQESEANKWNNFFLPIYDGEKITQNKVSIRRKPNQYIRFIVELSLEVMGDVQFDGLVKLKAGSNLPENFDLYVRFKDQLNSQVQTQISEIYLLNQNISGVKGGLNFERVDSFQVEPTNSL